MLMCLALISRLFMTIHSCIQFLQEFLDLFRQHYSANYGKTFPNRFGLLNLACMVLFSCDPKELPTRFIDTSDRIVVGLSHQTTRGDLRSIQDSLAKKEIIIDVTGSEFFENEHLRVLVLKVVFPGGAGGKTRADLMTLQHQFVGFEFDKAKTPGFVIGQLKK